MQILLNSSVDIEQVTFLADMLKGNTYMLIIVVGFLAIRELWQTLKGHLSNKTPTEAEMQTTLKLNTEMLSQQNKSFSDMREVIKDNARVLSENANAFREVSKNMLAQHEEMHELFIIIKEKLK
jgi:hypothetical protein